MNCFVYNMSENFLKPKVMFLNVLFCVTDSQKLKDIQFIITLDKEKQKILTAESQNIRVSKQVLIMFLIFIYFFSLFVSRVAQFNETSEEII